MPKESSVSRVDQVVRRRNLIYLAVIDVVLFVVANVTYGPGHEHGLRLTVSNVTWVLFVIGFLLLILLGVVALVQLIRRRLKSHA
jgi:hypothetical protein